ncbi:MAG: saccharopine dehydrogenase [Flavobacteriales bacterium]|nr:saccharopine dehydrogenase [Flavobacteriales bacterium]
MKQIIILGGGRVGSAMAHDLSKNYSVTVVDINKILLQKLKKKNQRLQIITQNLSDLEKIQKLIKPYDVVVCAVPGFMGFQTLKTIIQAKKHVVDISFFPENALELNDLAIKNKVTALVDFGVAPGLGNILFGHYDQTMDIDSYECYVGGLPKKKELPFEYKAPFSPIDVIEEYIRPARIFANSKIVTKEALTELETISFDQTGDLEAFNTDGLRSLLYTMSHVPNMIEKTLRYPGHVQKIQLLKDIGFFDQKIRTVNNQNYTPLEITADILKEKWFLKDKEQEFTVMRIIMNDKNKKVQIDLYDEYDHSTDTTSMARTTGYTCTAGVNLVINNLFTDYGIFPPEIIGQKHECYNFIIQYLEERNIILETKTN